MWDGKGLPEGFCRRGTRLPDLHSRPQLPNNITSRNSKVFSKNCPAAARAGYFNCIIREKNTGKSWRGVDIIATLKDVAKEGPVISKMTVSRVI